MARSQGLGSPGWLNALAIKKENDTVASIIDARGMQVGVVCLNVACDGLGILEHIAQAVAAHTVEG